jgi:hypothetical protein
LSSWLPFGFVPEHGVEDGEDFAGNRDQGDHLWFAGSKKPPGLQRIADIAAM